MVRRAITIPLFWASLWTLHGLIGAAFEVATTFDAELFFRYVLFTDALGALFTLTWVAAVVGLLARRRWLAAALTVPAIFFGSAASLSPLSTVDVAARWRLWREHTIVDRQIAASTASSGHRRLEWDWGAEGFAGNPGVFFTLVYDEADQLPSQLGSGTAKSGNYHYVFPVDTTFLRPLGDHFYFVSTVQQ